MTLEMVTSDELQAAKVTCKLSINVGPDVVKEIHAIAESGVAMCAFEGFS